MLEIKVSEIRGSCPVYRVGDKVVIEEPKDTEHAYMQCVDPGSPYTEGGKVIFECRRIEGE